jgi:alpha-galactosidase
MTRIVLVGAGSVEFTRNLLGDILSYPESVDATIVLHDIDADRLATAEKMASWTARALNVHPRVESELDRRAALKDADFVIDTIQVGGARATNVDFEIPKRYGLEYTINDTINVGGVMRGLRSIPVILGIVRDMEELCPEAWFLNYTNPMSMIIWAVTSRSGIKTVGLCHSVYWTVRAIADYTGVPYTEIDHVSAGVNHLAFLLRLTRDGEDLYPRLEEAVRDGRIPDEDLVRAELYRRLGYYPTESSEHHAEYNAWFIPKGQVDRFHIPIGEYLTRVARNLDEFEETKRKLAAGEPFEIERSGEYAAVIIHSIVTGDQSRIVGNVPNQGTLIPNLAADACVEVPCIVDGQGIRPLATGPLPPQLAAYIHPAVDAQGLTVKAVLEEDRDAIYHAVMQDPIVQARLTLDETWRMTDDLIAAEAEWLPDWLGGAVPAQVGMNER